MEIYGHHTKFETQWITNPIDEDLISYLFCRFKNKIVTAENISFTKNERYQDYSNYTSKFKYDHNAYHIREIIDKIVEKYQNIPKIDLQLWFTVTTDYEPFITNYSELSFDQHRLLNWAYIKHYPSDFSENQKILLAKDTLYLEIIEDLMERFNVIKYIKNNAPNYYDCVKFDLINTKYAKDVVNDILPKKGNKVRWCIKKNYYNLIPFIDSKIEFDECCDLLIKEVPKMIDRNVLNKEIIQKIEPFIEWKEYGSHPTKLQYTIKKELREYLSIDNDIEVFRLLKKYGHLEYYYIEIKGLNVIFLKQYGEKLIALSEIFSK